jgi:hypothetical protein
LQDEDRGQNAFFELLKIETEDELPRAGTDETLAEAFGLLIIIRDLETDSSEGQFQNGSQMAAGRFQGRAATV